ncbi:MAG: hypothetical protein AB2776_19445 [Candidatus Thiodiazotropha endolucinida]
MTVKIIEFIPPTTSALIRVKIQRETALLESRRGLNEPMSPRETLLMFADALEDNAVYLSELGDTSLEPVIDSIVGMAARIRHWLIE